MAANEEEHPTAVEAPDPAVIVPAEHHTATKRKEIDEEEKEIGPKRRMKCQLALGNESGRENGFTFDTKMTAPTERTPKFGSFKSSADPVDLGLGTTAEENTGGRVVSEEITGGAEDQEESGSE